MIVFAIVAFLIFVGTGDAEAAGLRPNTSAMPSVRVATLDPSNAESGEETLAARTQTNFVNQKEVKVVQVALEKFYVSCGYFPDQLDRLMDSQTAPQNCRSPLREPPLAPTAVHRDLISRLNYTPYGYDDYELSLRLVWTQSH